MNEVTMNEERLRKIQGIVHWREEQRVGLFECHVLGKLLETRMEDIQGKAKDLPQDVDVYVTGGLASKGFTIHDIDVFVVNRSGRPKDEVDAEIRKAFLGEKGRVFRIYNFDRFEEDMLHLKEQIERFDSTPRERPEICDKLNPILEIHSHCIPGETPTKWRVPGSPCETQNPASDVLDPTVFKCTTEGCQRVKG